MVEKSRLKQSKQKKKKRRWLKITGLVSLVLILGIFGYVYSIYHNAKQTVNEQMKRELPSIDIERTKLKVARKEKLNILLLGVDKRPGDRGRSDTMIILTLDPQANKMQMISIPRDTRTLIVGKGFEDKINHAYAFGGPDMSVATVENMLNIDIDYYVEINMEGLVKLVDAVGGITVYNELDWHSDGFHYAPGELHLNGKQALGYVRMRKQDPQGDFGRTKRQRQVIEAIIKKGVSVASVPKIDDMLDILGDNVATNMDFDDMKNLLLNYRNAAQNTETYMLQGKGTRINGIYYYIVPEEELAKVHEMIASK